MSIEKLPRDSGAVWRVRWREGGRNRARVLGRKRDAEAFDAEVRRRRRAGDLVTLDGSKESLGDFAREWFTVYAKPNLAKNTVKSYAGTWDRHVLPRIGGFPLRDLRPEIVQAFAADLARAGVGRAAIRRTLMILSSVLAHAEAWGRITSNPVRKVSKPSGKCQRTVRPLPPLAVERIRLHLLHERGVRDVTLVSVLAYAGVRPGEALALSWQDVRDRTLLITQSNADGELKATKTEETRAVRLLAPLAQDLAEYRLACGRPEGRALVFPNAKGEPWTEAAWRNWRRRVYRPAAEACGVQGSRPYDLRHSFCSILLREGATVHEVAAEVGNSPSMTLDTYGHVIGELKEAQRVSAEEVIRMARDELRARTRSVPGTTPKAANS